MNENNILLFGGYCIYRDNNHNETVTQYYDTWIYDYKINNWIQLFPPNHPKDISYRICKIGLNKVLLLGGTISYNEKWTEETWLFDLDKNDWTKLELDFHPQPRYNYSIVILAMKLSYLEVKFRTMILLNMNGNLLTIHVIRFKKITMVLI